MGRLAFISVAVLSVALVGCGTPAPPQSNAFNVFPGPPPTPHLPSASNLQDAALQPTVTYDHGHYPTASSVVAVGTGQQPATWGQQQASIAQVPAAQPAYQPSYQPTYRPAYNPPNAYSGPCAENGSCYGDISAVTGLPKTVAVRGYYRRDGTYVRGHYRSHR
jgi:hypothetical protein